MAIVKFRRGDGAEFEVEEGSPAYERILADGGFERAVVYHFGDVYEPSTPRTRPNIRPVLIDTVKNAPFVTPNPIDTVK